MEKLTSVYRVMAKMEFNHDDGNNFDKSHSLNLKTLDRN